MKGDGYKCTNVDGLNPWVLWTDGVSKIYKMTFSNKKDRNIKFEISKYGDFGDIWIENEAEIKKVSGRDVKKAMFIGDMNTWLVKDSNDRYYNDIFIAYPFGLCDSLNLSCIANQTVKADSYLQHAGSHTFMEDLEYANTDLKGKLNPDIIVFNGGWALDWGVDQIDEIKKEADKCYKSAKEQFPEATIIVIGTEYREIMDGWAKPLNEALRKTALDNACYYIDLCSGETISSSRKNNIKRKGSIFDRNGRI